MSFQKWQLKALKLRETLLVAGHQVAVELISDERPHFECMRAFNRGEIDGVEMKRRLDAHVDVEAKTPMMFEPASIDGWQLNAAFYKLDDELWWFLGVRKFTRTISPIERMKLAKILDVLGCDIVRDRLSTLPLEDLVREDIGYIWTWKNQHPLSEMQLKGKGSSAKSRIVPFGTPPSDGYETLDLSRKGN